MHNTTLKTDSAWKAHLAEEAENPNCWYCRDLDKSERTSSPLLVIKKFEKGYQNRKARRAKKLL